jgi:hypothetical protein
MVVSLVIERRWTARYEGTGRPAQPHDAAALIANVVASLLRAGLKPGASMSV